MNKTVQLPNIWSVSGSSMLTSTWRRFETSLSNNTSLQLPHQQPVDYTGYNRVESSLAWSLRNIQSSVPGPTESVT